MPIRFDADRWNRLKNTCRRWWAGELDRPIVSVTLGGADPGRPAPEVPCHGFHSFHGLDTPAEQVVDTWHYDACRQVYLGDAYPRVFVNFGPGVTAAFLGADLINGQDTVWYHPKSEVGLADLRFEYDPDNPWFRRVKDLCRVGIERFGGQVQIDMTDLGGNLDTLSSFRPGENLLLDLYDDPETVKKLTWDAHELWHRYFAELNSILQSANQGYSCWDGTFSEEPYYILQCDFAYMIGPEMFDEFVRPELEATSNKLARTIYHLDGPGQLAHLDSLLSIEGLDGIQWIPGAGQPVEEHWLDVYCRIVNAGKKCQISSQYASFELVKKIADKTGKPGNIQYMTAGGLEDEPRMREAMKTLGVPAE